MADDDKDKAAEKEAEVKHAVESIGRQARAARDGDLSKKPAPTKREK